MFLYHILSFLFLPVCFLVILVRILTNKEDIHRISERFAFGKKRHNNTFLVWVHAASVGESIAALTLIKNIHNINPDIEFLITTWTRSSARILAKRLPNYATHQFLPIDNIIFIRRFLNNWHPNLGIFIESELWPCTIIEGAKCCPLLLLNARISDKSFVAWQKGRKLFQKIVNNFSEVVVQSDVDRQKFNILGIENVNNLGNIKFANHKLAVDELELESLKKYFNNKRIITFASTHPEDEEIILPIIKKLKVQIPDCYFILIPRHPERIKSITDYCIALDLFITARSKSALPKLDDDLYIVDKFGEMGLFFSLSDISFIGGSFKQGGHNVLEAAFFSNCIVFGPDMSKNSNIAQEMLNSNAAVQISDAEDLSIKLQYLLSNGVKELETYQRNALDFVYKNQIILDNYLSIIKKYIC